MATEKLRKYCFLWLACFFCLYNLQAQTKYQNPVIPFDYSDPDVIRVNQDYYLIASSFNHVPGLPILHSSDLIHWQLVGHALPALAPEDVFRSPIHGGGVWAPALRFHRDTFYIYYPDPDHGIYRIQTTDIRGKWSDPQLVVAGKGLIDPCPFWDENGQVFLAFALAGSRAGMKSMLFIQPLNQYGDKPIGRPVLIYDGHEIDPTVEGPKCYFRNGYYYVFAPAGGVSTGWQLVLRSKQILGPYERKVVLHQGGTQVNGPHQGAWVSTPAGKDWFLHFQDRDAFGRIVHLQPMQWKDNWPIIGADLDGDGIGEPVSSGIFEEGKNQSAPLYQEFDDFDKQVLQLPWQWQANIDFLSAYPYKGSLHYFSRPWPMATQKNLWKHPNLLLRKIYAGASTVETAIDFAHLQVGETGGLIAFGLDYHWIGVQRDSLGYWLQVVSCLQAEQGSPERDAYKIRIPSPGVKFRLHIDDRALCSFQYQCENEKWNDIPGRFQLKPGKWVGAKLGYFTIRNSITNNAGWMEVGYYRSTPK